MIIEEKKIKVSDIVIPWNNVLIKPDPNYTEYQYKGRQTGIISSDFSYDEKGRRVSVKSKNYSVIGTVYGVPKNLKTDYKKANKIMEGREAYKEVNGFKHPIDKSSINAVQELRRNSVAYEVDIETQIGDRVRFSYMVHEYAMDNKAYIETDEGLMYFVRYDELFMVVDENLDPIRGLNGYILVCPDKVETKTEEGVTIIEGGKSLVLVADPNKEKRKRKIAQGTILCSSSPVRSYKDLHFGADNDFPHDKGDRIFYDPRGGVRLEMMNHQEYSEDDLVLIRRPDVLFSSRNNPDFDKIDFNL